MKIQKEYKKSGEISFLLFLIFNFSFFIGVFAQQDPQYSQYMFNRLAINPAYAGNRDVFSSAIVYRNQWTGLKGSPTTAALSVQTPLKKKNAGVALELMTDKMGLQKTSSVLGSYAYRIQFLKGKLAFGLRAGINSYVFDWASAHVKDEADIYNTGARSSKLTGTADFGMYYYTRTLYAGLGLTHLNRGKITDIDLGDTSSRQSVHFFIPFGKSFEAGSVLLNPSILVKGARNAPMETDINMNALFKERLWLGLSLRTRYGIVFMTQYLVTDQLKVGYSYDIGLNRIGSIGKGSHEIMLGYDLNFKGAKVETLRYF